jgi:LmbE family N-acetylglucosaminyl deacetylase
VRLRTACARDATARLRSGSVLVLAPHPDDETIACGLLLATKAARGEPVDVVLATDGGLGWFGPGPSPDRREVAAVRSREWHTALDHLGVEPQARHALGLPDGALADHEDAAVDRIAVLVADRRPSLVVAPSPDDLHADHRALAREARRVAASPGGDGHHPEVTGPASTHVVPE